MRLKFGTSVVTLIATLAGLAFTALPAAAASYPTSITTSGSAVRTNITDNELSTISNSNSQPYAFENLHNGFFYVGADSSNNKRIVIRSYSDGVLDTGFGSGTGQVSFLGQLASTARNQIMFATYANGTKWMLLEENWSFGTGLNYLHLGTYAGGYVSTITLPKIEDIYNTYCVNKPSSSFTQTGGYVTLIANSAYADPTLFLTCNAYLTTNGGSTSPYLYLVTVSGGTTIGTAGTYQFLTGTSVTPLATSQNPTSSLGGYSSWSGATGSQPRMTFFYYLSASTTTPWEASAYNTQVWSGRVVTRIMADTNLSNPVSVTTSAWSGVSIGSYTGTLMIPPTNNGTIYAIAHVSDTATSIMKVVRFGQSGAAAATVDATGSIGSAGPLARAQIVAAANPGSLQKVALKDGGSGGYWEIDGPTAVSMAGGKFTSSGTGSFDAFNWQPSEDSGGVSVYSRTSTTNITRLAFTTAPVAPSTPSAPTATRGNGQVALSWTAPSNGGSAITDYEIDYSSNSGSSWDVFADGTSSATSATVTGLTNGTAYVFRIRAVNAAGTSSSSPASSSVTPAAVPSAPTGVAGNFGNGQVALSWTAPSASNGSAITDYTIQYSSNAGASWFAFSHTASTATSATITGLTNGVSYTFRVAAVNGVGTSAYSADSPAIVPATLPSSVSGIPNAQAGDRAVTISWTAPAANGCAITDYEIQYTTNNGSSYSTFIHSPSDATTQTVTYLTNGTSYRFRVAPSNCAGTASFSLLSAAVVPNPVPSQTSGLSVATNGQSNQLVLNWTAPNNNGSAITDYLIEYSIDGGQTWQTYADGTSTSTTATLTNLTNGANYSFRVSAVSAIGAGLPSTSSAPVVAAALPGTFASAVSATSTPGQIALSWNAPASNGGSAITDYLIEYSSNGGSTWQTFAHTASAATTAVLTGLTPNATYTARVSAINSVGTGPVSTVAIPVVALAATAPGTITQTTAVAGSNPGEVALTWAAPAANGSAITDYTIEYSLDGGLTWVTFTDGQSTATTATITGLTAGTSYVFRVTAINGVGTATAGTASAAQTPAAPPAPPVSSTSTPTNQNSTPVNPRHVPGEVTFSAQRVIPSGSPIAIQGTNMDMVLIVLVENRSAKIVTQTETLIEVATPKNLLGYADVTLVYALGSIHFPRAVHIVESGPKTIALNTFWKHKLSQRSTSKLLVEWPKTVGASEVVCVAKYSRKSNRPLALWRAKRVCASLQAARPGVKYSVAVARVASMPTLELRVKY